jgi:hypothetical protein
MGRLICNLNVSLDGFVETVDHSLDWRASTTSCTPGSTTE